MRIMNGDKVVAVLVREDGKIPVFKAVEGTDRFELPLALFGKNKNEVSLQEFTTWAKNRVFPENRMDAAELLADLGLDHYDAWAIVKITKGRVFYKDDFWIDFSSPGNDT